MASQPHLRRMHFSGGIQTSPVLATAISCLGSALMSHHAAAAEQETRAISPILHSKTLTSVLHQYQK